MQFLILGQAKQGGIRLTRLVKKLAPSCYNPSLVMNEKSYQLSGLGFDSCLYSGATNLGKQAELVKRSRCSRQKGQTL